MSENTGNSNSSHYDKGTTDNKPVPSILEIEIKSILNKRKVGKAVGHDKVTNSLVKTFADEFTPTLTQQTSQQNFIKIRKTLPMQGSRNNIT